MPSVTYIEDDGTNHVLDVPDGDSVMQGAVNNALPGITAECGGALACATCHCYVDEAWISKVGTASPAELDMLEATAAERKISSRLSCQITVSQALDGLIVRLPKTQY
jgi:2Fe-2S ferredoxin